MQIEQLKNDIFMHQEVYTEKMLKIFYMDKSHQLTTQVAVRSLDINDDPFRPRESDEKLLGPKVPHLNTIEALMNLQVIHDLIYYLLLIY